MRFISGGAHKGIHTDHKSPMMQGFICRGGEIKQSLNMTQHQVCEFTWERIVLSASFFFSFSLRSFFYLCLWKRSGNCRCWRSALVSESACVCSCVSKCVFICFNEKTLEKGIGGGEEETDKWNERWRCRPITRPLSAWCLRTRHRAADALIGCLSVPTLHPWPSPHRTLQSRCCFMCHHTLKIFKSSCSWPEISSSVMWSDMM